MAQLSLNKDYITVYDGIIEPRLCDNLIEFFEKNIKHTHREETDHRAFQELNLSVVPKYEQAIGKLLRPYFDLYKKDNKISDYVWPQTFQMEHTRFKRYMPNTEDRFDIHADATTKMTSSRFLVLFVYLSNNDSGHTSFPDRDIKVQPKQGRLLMFPPNWCYPHVGEKVTDKPKYILGSYGHYADLQN